MPIAERKKMWLKTSMLSLASLGAGLMIGLTGTVGQAQTDPPTKHRGVSVAKLGIVPESSMQKQIGLDGYILQMREITLEPGGVIAKHSHAGRPGLVWTLSGSWTESRPGGQRDYPATEKIAIIEDSETEHWFNNNESEPLTAVVCDMVPPS